MSKLMRGIICLAIGAIIWFIPAPEGVSAQAWGLLAVFAATIAGFILQPMPIGACSIIGMTLLPLLGIMKAGQALEGFSNGTIWLIVSAFMSWCNPNPYNGFVRAISALTEPVFYRLRSRFPFLVFNGLDLTPVALLVVLQLFNGVVVQTMLQLGQRISA